MTCWFGLRDRAARDRDGVVEAVVAVGRGELQPVRAASTTDRLHATLAVVGVRRDPRCDGVCPLRHLDLLAERIELEQRREVQSGRDRPAAR